MGLNSNIEWTDHTFNAWIGCTKVSPGCKNCYAEADFDKRKGRAKWGPHGTRSITSHANWRQVLSWQKMAKGLGERKRVFVNSLADTFEDYSGQLVDHNGAPMWFAHEDRDKDGLANFRSELPEQWSDLYVPLTLDIVRRELFVLIDLCPDLDFLLLTKRPENIAGMWPQENELTDTGLLTKHKKRINVWLGFSAEDQARFDERAPYMVGVKPLCKYVFCSMEPLLGSINPAFSIHTLEFSEGHKHVIPWSTIHDDMFKGMRLLDWVIVGGESGTKARPMHPDWARSLRDQCQAAGVPFFFKQWGEHAPGLHPDLRSIHESGVALGVDGTHQSGRPYSLGSVFMKKVGKHAAGRLLDGVEHNELPGQ